MKTVGIRELRQNPTPVIRDVERGETYAVTVQNRPVAHLIPVPTSHAWVPVHRLLEARRSYADQQYWADIDQARASETAEDPWKPMP